MYIPRICVLAVYVTNSPSHALSIIQALCFFIFHAISGGDESGLLQELRGERGPSAPGHGLVCPAQGRGTHDVPHVPRVIHEEVRSGYVELSFFQSLLRARVEIVMKKNARFFLLPSERLKFFSDAHVSAAAATAAFFLLLRGNQRDACAIICKVRLCLPQHHLKVL